MALPIQGEKIESSNYKLNSTTITNVWHEGRKRQHQIEACVLLCFIIMFVQLFFGSFRRKSSSGIVKLLLWGAYNSSYFLVNSTIGMMLSFPFDGELIAIWANCLYMVLGSTDTLSAYSLEDNDNWTMRYYQQILQGFYIGFLFSNLPFSKFAIFIYIWYVLIGGRVFQRISSIRMAGKSFDLQKHTKVIADHMKRLHENNQQGQPTDPISMNGYHYVVTGEEELKPKAGSHTIEIDINSADIITVEKVWKCKGMLLNPVRDSGSKLRDVCLSFALFKMLRRRFSGYPFAECLDRQTKSFVFEGLLSEDIDGHYERAFRVVEIELGFLYDYFFTKYPVIYLNQKHTLIISLLIVIADCIVVWKLIMKRIYLETIITLSFVGLLIIFEGFQIYMYIKSDWAKVSLTSKYVAKPHWQGNPCIEGILGPLCKERGRKRWQNSLGQYSFLLHLFSHRSKCAAITHCLKCESMDNRQKGQKIPKTVCIPDSVRREIISALKLSNGYVQIRNGMSSLDRNGFSQSLSWACSSDRSDTETILIWHVATTLCEMYTTNQQPPTADRITVATYLSRYCGYLVAFAPELLPDNKYDIELIFDSVVQEAKGFLRRAKSTDEVYERLIEAGDISPSNKSILSKGAGLANELLVLLDEPMRWKVLAEFWAEMILYLAPSDNATAHLKHLTQGGEFLTHLWTLLSHAGILERLPKTNRAGSETV